MPNRNTKERNRVPVTVLQDPHESLENGRNAVGRINLRDFSPIRTDHELSQREQQQFSDYADLAAAYALSRTREFRDPRLQKRIEGLFSQGEQGKRFKTYVAYLEATDTNQRRVGWSTVMPVSDIDKLNAYNRGETDEMPEIPWGNRDVYGVGRVRSKDRSRVRNTVFRGLRSGRSEDATFGADIAESIHFGDPMTRPFFGQRGDVKRIQKSIELNPATKKDSEATGIVQRLKSMITQGKRG